MKSYIRYLRGEYPDMNNEQMASVLREQVLERLNTVQKLVLEENYNAVRDMCFLSATGDYAGTDDNCINFADMLWEDENGDFNGFGDVINIIQILKAL